VSLVRTEGNRPSQLKSLLLQIIFWLAFSLV
jgi:hypothetical protein